MSFKMVFLPPNSQHNVDFMTRLQDSVPDANLVAPMSEDEAVAELANADAAFGTMNPRLVAAAPKLRWLQAPGRSAASWLLLRRVDRSTQFKFQTSARSITITSQCTS